MGGYGIRQQLFQRNINYNRKTIMPKGHRRTQSSNLVLSSADNAAPLVQNEAPTPNHQIIVLLAKSNDKVKEKISNVEVLHSQSLPESSFFNFGKGCSRNSQFLKGRQLEEEYMLGSHCQPDHNKIPQEYQINQAMSKPFGKKQKTGIGVTQVQPRFQRTPFFNTINHPQLVRKPKEKFVEPRQVKMKRVEERIRP